MDEALALEQQNKRSLAADKRDTTRGQTGKASNEAATKLKEETILAAKKATLRAINSAFAASIVGLIVSLIFMTIQWSASAFGSKFWPKPAMWEKGATVGGWILVGLVILAALVLGAFIVELISNPGGLLLDIIF